MPVLLVTPGEGEGDELWPSRALEPPDRLKYHKIFYWYHQFLSGSCFLRSNVYLSPRPARVLGTRVGSKDLLTRDRGGGLINSSENRELDDINILISQKHLD